MSKVKNYQLCSGLPLGLLILILASCGGGGKDRPIASGQVAGTGGIHDLPFTDPVLHGPEAKKNLAFCQDCHGTPGTILFDGGSAPTACSVAACHPDAGTHPTRWQGTNDVTPNYLSSHRDSGNLNTACRICHDFTQGRTPPNPAAPSCFSANFTNADGSTTGCHPAGPDIAHQLPFTDPTLHGPEAKGDLTFCQQCHADPFDGGPGSNPRFNVPLGNLVNGCEDCHQVNTAHPAPLWASVPPNSHKTAGNLAVACALCHGANLQGSAEGGIGPACAICHTAGSPVDLANCSSCHNDPPDSALPAGDTRPNREGGHGTHNDWPKVTGVCATCHDGFGTETINHFDGTEPADISILSSYDAKTGAAAYDPGTMSCTNASCHGGQLTPDWLTGVIDVAADCESCHELGTAQFNSYNSGEHDEHVREEGIGCTECHDTTKLVTSHFIGLDTPVFEGEPAETIRDAVNYSPPSCNPSGISGCHGSEDWEGDD